MEDQKRDGRFSVILRYVAVTLGTCVVLFSLHPFFALLACPGVIVFVFARMLRRQNLTLDEGGLMTDDTLGLVHRYVPYGRIDRLEFEGRELVARDARGSVLCRSYGIVTARAIQTFEAIEAAVASADGSPTGFERGDARLEDWLERVDAGPDPSLGDAYRRQARDWALALGSFRNAARTPEVRAAAAWVLLGSEDPDHREAVIRSIGPRLPPLVLAVCALRSSSRAAAALARDRLRYLGQSDRRAWKRMIRAGGRSATPPLAATPNQRLQGAMGA